MKNFINWTLGSFFRTIGRIIAYIGIGLLVFFVLDKNNIKITDLIFLNVKASTYSTEIKLTNASIFTQTDNSWLSFGSTLYYKELGVPNNNIYETDINFNVAINDNDYISFPFLLQSSALSNTQQSTTFLSNCTKYIYDSDEIICSQFNTYSFPNTFLYNELNLSSNSIFASAFYYDNNDNLVGKLSCSIQNNEIYCPSPHNTYLKGLDFIFSFNSPSNSSNLTYFYLSRGYNQYVAVDTASAINNQTQQQHTDSQNTQNAINNVTNTINNDNTSTASSNAGNFLNGFNTNTHGLTSIITAPLNAIQSLTSSSCSALVLPLPFVNRNLTLPCMRDIYLSNFGSFMNLYDIITFGIISYWVLVKIFALVKDFKNPEHDEVEVMDL